MTFNCFIIINELISHDSVLILNTETLFLFYREVKFFNLRRDQTPSKNGLKPSSKEY